MKSLVSKQNRQLIVFISSITLLALSILSFNYFSVNVSNIKLTNIKGNEYIGSRAAWYPLAKGNYLAETVAVYSKSKSSKFKITTEGCVLTVFINQIRINLPEEKDAVCNNPGGVVIDLAENAQEGENQVTITLAMPFDYTRLHIGSDITADRVLLVLGLAIVLNTIAGLFSLFRIVGLNRTITLIFLAGLLLRIWYLVYTPYNNRAHDIDGHVVYIDHLLEKGALPRPGTCWECHQPPGYYLVAAPVAAIANISNFDPMFLESIVSLAFTAGFLLISLLTLHKWLPHNNRLLLFGYLIVAFWPSAIIHSSRITNDSLNHFLWIFSFYFTTEWWLRHNNKHLFAAIIVLCLGAFVKTTMLIPMSVLILLMVFKHLKTEHKLGWKLIVLTSILFAACIGIPQTRHILFQDNGVNVLLGRTQLIEPNQFVGRDLDNFICFQPEYYFSQPENIFINPQRQSCSINFLLKTSQVGEFDYFGTTTAALIKLIAVLGLIIPAGLVLSALFIPRKQLKQLLRILLFCGVSLLGLLVLRFYLPIPATGDFRYILPVIVPLTILQMKALQRVRTIGKGELYFILTIAISVMLVASIFFLVFAIPLQL